MEDLVKAHKIFRDEVTAAAWSFFVWKSFNRIVSKDDELYQRINVNALSWNVITHSLQSTFFITIGRLFDIDGAAFSVHAFLRSCIENIGQFSLEALRQRKIDDNGGVVPDWLDDYMANSYTPTENDFQRIRGEVSKYQKVYEDIYKPIRHQLIAHKEKESIEKADELFGKTNIGHIEELLDFFHQIENIVFDLLHNGKLNEIGFYSFSESERVEKDVNDLLEKLKA